VLNRWFPARVPSRVRATRGTLRRVEGRGTQGSGVLDQLGAAESAALCG